MTDDRSLRRSAKHVGFKMAYAGNKPSNCLLLTFRIVFSETNAVTSFGKWESIITESSFTRMTPDNVAPMKPFLALKEKYMASSDQLLKGSLIVMPPGNWRRIKSSRKLSIL